MTITSLLILWTLFYTTINFLLLCSSATWWTIFYPESTLLFLNLLWTTLMVLTIKKTYDDYFSVYPSSHLKCCYVVSMLNMMTLSGGWSKARKFNQSEQIFISSLWLLSDHLKCVFLRHSGEWSVGNSVTCAYASRRSLIAFLAVSAWVLIFDAVHITIDFAVSAWWIYMDFVFRPSTYLCCPEKSQ